MILLKRGNIYHLGDKLNQVKYNNICDKIWIWAMNLITYDIYACVNACHVYADKTGNSRGTGNEINISVQMKTQLISTGWKPH